MTRRPPAAFFFTCLAAVLLARPLAGQTPAAPAAQPSIFVPFVSMLTGEIKNNLLKLSWVDSPSVKGPVYVYRSTAPFQQGVPLGRAVEIPYGALSYIDEIDTPGLWYYFVVASDENGRRYELPIPFNNSISVTVTESPIGLAASTGDPSEAPAVVSGPMSAGADPGVAGIAVSRDGDRVTVTFTMERRNGDLVLYRSVRPLREPSDLVGATVVQAGITSPCDDYPVPGIPYYYAVIPGRDVQRGTVGIFPGRNATVEPVEVAAGQYQIGPADTGRDIRRLPLPTMSVATVTPPGALAGVPETNGQTPAAIPLSPAAEAAVAALPSPVRRPPPDKKPRAFARDLESPGGGEEYDLRRVVQGSFSSQDWETCRDELLRYLSLPRSAPVEARARFYLGQCYFFLSRARESLFEFLAVETEYPDEAAEWIQAALNLLVAGSQAGGL